MSSDIHCPSCAAPVPVEKPELGQQAECHHCKLQFPLTAEMVFEAERTVFRPAPRRYAAIESKPAAPATGYTPSSQLSDTACSLDTGRIWRSPRIWYGAGAVAAALVITVLFSTLGILAFISRANVAAGKTDEASLLSSGDSEVQLAALNSRRNLGSGTTELPNETYALICNLLASPNPQIRRAAVDCLTSSNLSPASRASFFQQLLGLLSDKDTEVAMHALAAIVSVKNPTDSTLADSLKTNLPQLLPGFVTLTAHSDPKARRWAMRTLHELGPEVAKADSGPVRQPGGKPPAPGLRPKIIANLADIYVQGVADERPLAAQALRAIDAEGTLAGPAVAGLLGETAEMRLLTDLKEADVDKRRFAAFALGSPGPSGPAFPGGFSSGPFGGGSSASETLIAALVEATLGDDLTTTELALKSLSKVDAKGNHTAAALRKEYSDAAAAALSGLLRELDAADVIADGETASPEGAANLRRAARLHLLHSLGQLGPLAVTAERDLLDYAAANDAGLKQAAENSLRQIRGELPLDSVDGNQIDQSRGALLVERLKDIDKEVRTKAAGELEKLKDQAFAQVEPLLLLAAGNESGCREAAAQVLNSIDPNGSLAATYLRPPHNVLARISDKSSHEILTDLLKTEPQTRRFASRALAELEANSPAAIGEFVALLRENDGDLRRDVFYTLSRLDPSGAQLGDALLAEFRDEAHLRVSPSFKDPDPLVQACLSSLLIRLNSTNPMVAEFLAKALANADLQVQATARNILTNINPAEVLKLDGANYRRFMSQASAELERGDEARANAALDACSPLLRKFEWHFCRHRLRGGKLARDLAARGGVDSSGNAVFPPDLAVVPFRATAPIGQVTEVRFGPDAPTLNSGVVVMLGETATLDGGLAAAGSSGRVALWSLGGQHMFESFAADASAPVSIAFDGGGGRLLTVGTKVNLWQLPHARNLGQYPLNRAAVVHGGNIHSSGAQAAFACGNHLRLWKISSLGSVGLDGLSRGTEVSDRATESATAEVVDFAFGVDGFSLLAGLKNGNVVLWAGADKKPVPICQHGERIDAFAYSKDGRFVAAGGPKYVSLWTIDGATITKVPLTMPDGVGAIRALEFTPEGDRLAAGDADGKLVVWDTAGGDAVLTYKHGKSSIRSLSFHGSGKLLAVAALENQVDVLNGLPLSGSSPGVSPYDFAESSGMGGVPGGDGESVGGPMGPPSGSHLSGPGVSGRSRPGRAPRARKRGEDDVIAGEEEDMGAPFGGPPKGPGGLGGFPGGAPGFPGGVPGFPGGFPGFPGGFPGGVPGGGLGPGAMPDKLDDFDELDEKTTQRTYDRVDKVIASYDKDLDEEISKAEAKGTLGASFKRIDTDEDEHLNREELFEFFRPKTKKKTSKSAFAP